jgi:hypothetical protein
VGQSHGRNALSQRDFEVDVGVFRSGARPPHNEVIAFIDNDRDQFAVELICRTLRATIVGFLTFRGYRAAKARPRSARAIRDELLIDELQDRPRAELLGRRGREDARRDDPTELAGRA